MKTRNPGVEVSVVIPTFRRQSSLRRLLDSLEAQGKGGPRFEVIVVDDRSGEDLGALVGSFKDRLDISWMTSAAKGRPGARNTGAAAARGRVLWFLDDDMTVTPGAMKAHLDALSGQSDVSIGAIASSSAGQGLWNALDDSRFDLHRDQAETTAGPPPFTAFFTGNLAMKRPAFQALGGFDQETFSFYGGEDFDLGLRSAQKGLKAGHSAGALAHHQDEAMGFRRYLERCRWSAASMAVFLRKHPSALERHNDFMEVESGPMRNTGARPWWRTAPAIMLMLPPLAEGLMAVAEALWRAGLKNAALGLARFARRFLFNRHLARALAAGVAP